MSFLSAKSQQNASRKEVEYSLEDYLNLCKTDKMAYASAAERLLAAIGEPAVIDTSKEPRLARIFQNRTIRTYTPFSDFYGIEDTIERLVNFIRSAAQGTGESRKILHMLGPVGSAKSTLAERLKALMETYPIYVLCANGVASPVFESPLGLFDPETDAAALQEEYGIPLSAIKIVPSPWALKRLAEFEGDINKFTVRKMWPSRLKQIAVSRTEPGDANTSDVTGLIGKCDIRQLEHFSQNDPDSYSYSGGLNRGNQGLCECVEIFKAQTAVLNPLLAATQENHYAASEPIGQLPWSGMLVSHANFSENNAFTNNKKNEAFVDRMGVVKVPYTLRVTEEAKIYEKMLRESSLANAPLAPHTLNLLARFSVLSRLEEHQNSTLYAKLCVYDGQDVRETEPRAKSLTEYKDAATENEGTTGISTRFAMTVLASVFNYDASEVAADPIHLFVVLRQAIERAQFPQEQEEKYLSFVKDELESRYAKDIEKDIQTCYVESYATFGQNLFDRYVQHADAWMENADFRDPDTGTMLDRSALNDELSKVEKAAGIGNPKDFRSEVVRFCLRYRANNGGNNPDWRSYEKIREVIEAKMFGNMEDLLPVISFGAKQDSETAEKHQNFLARMMEKGYTEKQVRRVVEWFARARHSQ